MPVIDASVLVDALVGVGAHGDAARTELCTQAVLQVPAIFTAEATSAVRGLVRRGALDPVRAATAVAQIHTVRTIQYPFEPLGGRVWRLRDSITVYDAWYVALAEWLSTDLVTPDKRLLRATGPRCRVRTPG